MFLIAIRDRLIATQLIGCPRVRQAVIEDCKVNGQFDVSTMGNVSNVGLLVR